ncbi:MAG: peptidylprolyl isomerase, partial [Duncaniella sp.]|nr:peptidylprolyl isomerase [Duncaniella sp.]
KDGKIDSRIKVGAKVPMLTGDGYQITGRVLEVTPTHVKMDFNHPLVGKDLLFKGKVAEVRDARPEELHPTCGGCGGSCGSNGGSCGCDGGCGGCE